MRQELFHIKAPFRAAIHCSDIVVLTPLELFIRHKEQKETVFTVYMVLVAACGIPSNVQEVAN